MKVLVIVVTYNGEKWIEKCFSSLLASSIPLQILAVDNASSDNTVSEIKTQFPKVKIIETGANLGFGKANNIGLRKALVENADYVFLLNQDAWVEKDTIEKLIQVAEKNPKYGIVSPFHYDYEGSGFEVFFRAWVLTHFTAHWKEELQSENYKEIYESSFVHAACWLMPIKTVKEIGGFDPLFFHYGEDNDYVQRLHAKNKLIGIVPAAKVFHFGSNEGLKNPRQNIPFLINEGVLLFKNPMATNKGALLLFCKQFLKLHLRSFSNPLSKAYRFNLCRLLGMMNSRKLQKQHFAYLK